MLFALQQSLLMFTPSLLTVYKETRDFNKLIAISCPVRTSEAGCKAQSYKASGTNDLKHSHIF